MTYKSTPAVFCVSPLTDDRQILRNQDCPVYQEDKDGDFLFRSTNFR